MGLSINDVNHFLRFLIPPSPCHPFYQIGLWSNVTFWQILLPPKQVTSFMDSPYLKKTFIWVCASVHFQCFSLLCLSLHQDKYYCRFFQKNLQGIIWFLFDNWILDSTSVSQSSNSDFISHLAAPPASTRFKSFVYILVGCHVPSYAFELQIMFYYIEST